MTRPSSEMLQMILPPERGDRAMEAEAEAEIWVKLSITVRSA